MEPTSVPNRSTSPEMATSRLPRRGTPAPKVDVAVVGGGPAGSTVSTLLAMQGHAVALFERETFPRFHIGESLITETYWPLKKLGMLDRLRKSASPVKASVQFYSGSGRASKPFYFFDRDPHESSYTWQVERAWFDQALIENAAEKGVRIHGETSVREVVFEGDRAIGVRIQPRQGEVQFVGARVVVDASGLSSMLARHLGIQKRDPELVKAAIFAHFENGLRDPGIDEGATLILQTEGNRGWFWYIPLSRNRVSVGLVASPKELFADGLGPEAIFEREIERTQEVTRRLQNACRSTEVRVLSDFSYRATRCAGEGWVLVGDAFGFLDPVYSSGVFLALKSGELAAESIDGALRSGDLGAESLGRFGAHLTKGMEAFRKLIYAFYSPGFSFARFIREHPEHRDRVTDILVGDVFGDDLDPLFESMRAFCDLPEDASLAPGSATTGSSRSGPGP